MSHDSVCPNCDAPTGGNFCAQCGQETHLHRASTREFLHEFIGHYVALEGKLWGTLKRLLFRPGELTNEYIRGRRVRYLQPLRVYLTFSVIFFVLLKLTGGVSPMLEQEAQRANADMVAAAGSGAGTSADSQAESPLVSVEVGHSLDDWPTIRQKWQALQKLSQQEQLKLFTDGIYRYAPYAVFCLMPVFALLLKLLYLGSGRSFGEHMLFALHSNAFAYLIFSLILLSNVVLLDRALWVWLIGYLPWAMRRVYHSSRVGTCWRWLLLMLFFLAAVALAVLSSAVMGLMSVH